MQISRFQWIFHLGFEFFLGFTVFCMADVYQWYFLKCLVLVTTGS